MHKPLFFIINLVGTVMLGESLLSWWLSIRDAGLISLTVAVTIAMTALIFLAAQVLYFAEVVFSGE